VEGVARNFKSGTDLIGEKKPMVAILDMCSEGISPCLRWIEEIVKSHPEIPIFAVGENRSYETVRKFMGAGATEYLLKPVTETDLSSALQKFTRFRLSPEAEQPKGGRIYTVCSAKSGIGATTLAVNLAACIYEATKEPTIVVDMDLIGGDVPAFLKLKSPYTISDAARYLSRTDKSYLSGIVASHESGISVLAGPHDLEEGISITGETAGEILSLLKTVYKHIVVDTEANLTQATMAAINMSDLILLTLILSHPSIKNTRRYLKFLDKDSKRGEKIKIVVNRYFEKSGITIADAEGLLNRPVFWYIPNDFKTAMACLDEGMLLGTYAPRSKLSASIKDLAMTVTGKKADTSANKAKISPFNRLFRKTAS
jgi:pilus assembly protein CpaE